MRIHMGVLHVTHNFDKLAEGVKRQMTGLIKETTEGVREEYVRKITTGPRTGRMYGKHRASAPGESPKSKTGRLVASAQTEYPDNTRGLMKVEFPAVTMKKGNEYYARFLEFGTRKMKARPTIRPIMEKTGPEYAKAVSKMVKAEAKAAEVK